VRVLQEIASELPALDDRRLAVALVSDESVEIREDDDNP
jgi:hypothetical protein